MNTTIDTKRQIKITKALELLAIQKGISKDEMNGFIKEVLKKAFSKSETEYYQSYSPLSDIKPIIPEYDVRVELDIDKGIVSIARYFQIVDAISSEENKYREILVTDERLVDKQLKIGDEFIENIDVVQEFQNNPRKLNIVRQLILQKTKEVEKNKLYEAFIDKKGNLIYANVSRIESNYALLDYQGTAIFLPKSETSPLDQLEVGKEVLVYVITVDNVSKNAQVVASRTHPHFVLKLIEREIEDVIDNIVKVEAIAREPGVKTKIAVSTSHRDVDPIASIIGPKGQRIRLLIDELRGEKIDVIYFSTNLKEYILNALLLDEEVCGINLIKDDAEAQVIVKDDAFLQAIGKRGFNVKLASKLVRIKISVLGATEAKLNNITWEEHIPNKKNTNARGSFAKNEANNKLFEKFDFKNKPSIDDILSIEDTEETDYNLDDNFSSKEKNNDQDN